MRRRCVLTVLAFVQFSESMNGFNGLLKTGTSCLKTCPQVGFWDSLRPKKHRASPANPGKEEFVRAKAYSFGGGALSFTESSL
jgi:hypothetical protein